MNAGAWQALESELDAWQAAGHAATLWLRDDDARVPSPALDRLVALSGDSGVPLGLAVIPEGSSDGLSGALGVEPVTVLQHGYAHANHATPPAKKCELGDDRPLEFVRGELEAGRDRLARTFGQGFLPVLVPPWNRISESVCNLLGEIGFHGLSTFGPRPDVQAAGVALVNTHVDLIDWRGSRGFVGTASALTALTGHLEARRQGGVDPGEPTGVLSHHLDHDGGCWEFLEALFSSTASHPAVRWLEPAAAFGEGVRQDAAP